MLQALYLRVIAIVFIKSLNVNIMKLIQTIFTGIFISLFFLPCSAQFPSGYGWKVPRKSPQASLSQVIGVTNVDIHYSRPNAKGRSIWGEKGVIPLNKVWRAGANEATTISFDTPIQIDTTVVQAGTYALFLLAHSSDECTFILNSRPNQWGAFTYDKSLDVLRFKTALLEVPHQEALLYYFQDFKPGQATLNIQWGERGIAVPVKVDLSSTVRQSAASAFDWQAGFFAAQYYMDELKDYEEALKWINAALALDENLSSLLQKSSILEKMERWEEAIEVAKLVIEKTKDKSDSRSQYFYKKIISSQKKWEQKLSDKK